MMKKKKKQCLQKLMLSSKIINKTIIFDDQENSIFINFFQNLI